MRWFPSDSALSSRQSGHAERSPRSGSAAHNLPSTPLPAVRLHVLPVDEALALLAGKGAPGSRLRWHQDYPMPETVGALAMVVAAHQAVESLDTRAVPKWWLHQIVLDGQVVGDVGFHGPPAAPAEPGEDGGEREETVEVEIGYNVVEGLRGRGIATRACQLLAEQAWRDGASVVRAATQADNVASQRVLLHAGFHDEGGLCFVLAGPKAAA